MSPAVTHEPGSHGDRRVLGVPAGGERVRSGDRDEKQPGHWKACAPRERLDDVEQLRRLLAGERLRTVDRQRDSIAEPIRDEVHHHDEDGGDRQTAGAAQPLPHRQRQRGERSQQHGCLEVVA
jgi:hypothetical protein